MLWASGLQVVVLAGGRGARMTELIGSAIPKCLIPFGGNPLLFYPLRSLVANGFAGKEVLVIIPDRDDVRKTVLKLGEKLGLLVDTFGVAEEAEDFGTAEALRLALQAKKITRDALIISCDLVGDLPIQKVLDLHGLKDSAFTSLYMKGQEVPAGVQLPGPRSKFVPERDIVGVNEGSGELVFMGSEADMDEDLVLPTATLKKFPNFKLYTWLTDCHLYIVKKEVLDKLFEKVEDAEEEDEKHLSLKGEFLPWIVQKRCEMEGDQLPCYTLIEKEKLCLRINSVRNYLLACQSSDWLKELYPNCISRAKETKIAKGCKLVAAILGDHCTVGDKCKLTNVITLDHVKIEASCELTNVVISSNAQIGEGSVLKDCIVGPKYQVVPGSKHTNEHLTVVDDAFFEP